MRMCRTRNSPWARRSSAATARSSPAANVENAAYGDTICAERTAAVKAVSSGHRDFVRIAIWGNSKEYCYPCGSCRQFLQEFSKHMTVLCAKGDGSFVSHKLSEMMPFFFDF